MKINGGYSDLWKAIIRPQRENYHISDLGKFKFEFLGPSHFRVAKRSYKRVDL